MTMLDRWQPWYRNASRRNPYGPLDSYHTAEEHLQGLDVEDWGCGYAYFGTIHRGGYIGVDGTPTPWCDVVADLTEYRSTTPGLMLRGVLDHNAEWRSILTNAIASFTERMVLVLFTPPGNDERIGYVAELDVADYALPHDEIDAMFDDAGVTVTKRHLPVHSGYDGDRLWLASRS